MGGEGMVGYTRPQMRALHDRSVTFEEYAYYAQITRAEEQSNQAVAGPTRGFLSTIMPSKSGEGVMVHGEKRDVSDVMPAVNLSNRHNRAVITDEEWTNASRAVRTATIGAIFYLITTDILGPFGLPYAFATTGWG